MRLRNITTRQIFSVFTTEEGYGIVGDAAHNGGSAVNSSNSKVVYTVMSGASTIYPVYENAQINWGTTSTSRALTIQGGMRPYSGSTPGGVGWVTHAAQSLAAHRFAVPIADVPAGVGGVVRARGYVLRGTGA